MSQPKLDILMATYNGEAYISQQIYSLQQQTFTDWRLLIHDDGSTDRTIEIIRELAATDQRICLIEDRLCFHSAGRNLCICSRSPQRLLYLFATKTTFGYKTN